MVGEYADLLFVLDQLATPAGDERRRSLHPRLNAH
jgi:hypothetical protein